MQEKIFPGARLRETDHGTIWHVEGVEDNLGSTDTVIDKDGKSKRVMRGPQQTFRCMSNGHERYILKHEIGSKYELLPPEPN